MCDGKCICKERNEALHNEIKELIMRLDMKMSHLEFFAIKNRLMFLIDELK